MRDQSFLSTYMSYLKDCLGLRIKKKCTCVILILRAVHSWKKNLNVFNYHSKFKFFGLYIEQSGFSLSSQSFFFVFYVYIYFYFSYNICYLLFIIYYILYIFIYFAYYLICIIFYSLYFYLRLCGGRLFLCLCCCIGDFFFHYSVNYRKTSQIGLNT